MNSTDCSPGSTRIPLPDGHADVDHTDGLVELTVRLGGRVALGLTLTADEARNIGTVLTAAGAR